MCLYRHQQDTIVLSPSHHGNKLLSSDAGATLLAPKPGNGTNNVCGLQRVQNYSRQHCPLASLVHWEHDVGREGGG
eukprot:12225829-Ditylum_brightwellii.AAC.1